MINRNASRLGIALIAACLTLAGNLQAQFGSLTNPSRSPQAQSQEEMDAYLAIVSAAEPSNMIEQVDAFVRKFPASELLSSAYDAQLHACEQLNDFVGMLTAGRRSLAGSPDNLNTLLSLSSAIANRAGTSPERNRLLSEAKQYADRALADIDRLRIPQKIPLEQWHTQKRQMQSEAHGALGIVALQNSDLPQALSELETAVTLAPKPDGVQYLRLGLALASAGRKQDAIASLRSAVELGPEPVRNLAVGELKKLSRATSDLRR